MMQMDGDCFPREHNLEKELDFSLLGRKTDKQCFRMQTRAIGFLMTA